MLKAVRVGDKYTFFDSIKNISFSFNETAWNITKYVKEKGKNQAIKKLTNLYKVDKKIIKKDVENVLDKINSYGLSINDFPKEVVKITYSPIIVEIDITSKCNSNCIYCLASERMKDSTELPKEKIIDLINQFNDLNTWSITLSGGEPTLREDLFEILEHCNNLEMNTNIFTNGMNIDKKMAEKISKYKYVDVQVSLDSCIPEHHDKNRGGKGCFEKTIKGIKNLLNFNISVTIAMLVTPININDIEVTASYLNDLKIKNVRISSILMMGRAKEMQKKVSLSDKQLKTLGRKIMKLSEKYKGEMIFSKSPKMISFTGDATNLKNPVIYCNIGKYALYVSSNGHVYPCMYLAYPEFRLGDVKKDKIVDIWNSEKNKKLQKLSYKDIEKCRNCKFNTLCTGGCKGSVYQNFKTLLAPDPVYCSYFGVELSEQEKNKYKKYS